MAALAAEHVVWSAALLGLGLAVSMALDRLVQPGGAGFMRPLPAGAIHAGLFFVFWSSACLLSGRPGFAAVLTFAGQGLVIAVSNAKYRALREPLVFSDLVLYSQVLRFPRLYLPFLGIGRAVAVVAGLCAAAAVGLFLEAPWADGRAYCLTLLGSGAALLAIGTFVSSPPSLNPARDLKAWGLFPSLWVYTWASLVTRPILPPRPWLNGLARRHGDGPLPDLLVVQSESFFDARRLYPGVRADLLVGFDALRGQALAHGRLSVPAWGANTMRTEFAVLTGLAPDVLGVHQFNPYLSFARRGLLALPHRLRSLGYRTLCIHPHPAGFFGRDRIFPGLGFDAFIDIEGFPEAPLAGPYVADAAVTRKVAEVLAEGSGPTFIFVITMENHGPLHLERVAPGDLKRLYRQAPPAGWDDLTIYLRHLVNADHMLQDLAAMLAARPRGGLLCLYGDHVPSLPRVYADLRFTDSDTDYLIWSTDSRRGRHLDLAAHQLPEVLLSLLGESGRPPAGAGAGGYLTLGE